MQPSAVASHRFQNRERADHVGEDGRHRVVQRVVDVALCGEVHHCVALGNQFRHQVGVGDVALDERDRVLDFGQRLAPAGVGQGVENRHVVLGIFAHRAVHEVGADEAGASGDEKSHERKR